MSTWLGNAAMYERLREEYQANAHRARKAGDEKGAARWQAHADRALADRDRAQRYEQQRLANRAPAARPRHRRNP